MILYRIQVEMRYIYHNSMFSLDEQKVKMILHKFETIKETPCGYWFYDLNHKKRWVSKDSKVAYAYPKIQDARRNFIKRTEKRKEILEYHLNLADKGLELIKTFYKPKEKP